VTETDLRVNGGFFLFRRQIFDYMRPGEELVQEPFERLIEIDQLQTYAHDGFTATMDTFKDKQHFDELYAKGKAPWEVWRKHHAPAEVIAALAPLPAANMQPLGGASENLAVKFGGGDPLSRLNRRPSETLPSPAQT
jgi:NDP-sugar pyrophosphorylase family protein